MYQRILIPIDLNEQGFADQAIRSAVWHAEQSGGELHLLTVLPGIHMSMVATYFPRDAANKMKQEVQQRLQNFAQQYLPSDINHQLHIDEGKPYATILQFAAQLNADLIIMPSHKRSRIDKVMLGSVASKVVENSPIPVLVIKPQ